jgi:hypothetical protein
MYSFLVEARVLPERDYQFFEYNGSRPVSVAFRGRQIDITKGMRFGVRPSSNGKLIRLIFPKDPTRVLTIDLDTATKLARGIKKPTNASSEVPNALCAT